MSVVQDILQKIESQIAQANIKDEFSNKWEIYEIKDGVATVIGLQDVKFSEIVEFENWLKWLVLDLLQDMVWVLVLWDYATLSQWQIVKSSWVVFSVGVGESYLGRVVDGLGNPIDGKGEISFEQTYPVERIAPWVITRKSVDVPMQTWIKAIDTMVPVGRGQRELIIWDRQTWKTTVAIDTILNQKWNGVYCIYVAIGQKESKVRRIVETLKEKGAMDYTIVVDASASSPSVIQYLAPYVGCSLGEYFMYNGKDALIIYDDLSKHAVAYREVSLLLRRPPGREAYPWDVFYSHSRLLERAARIDKEYGWGSLTALPIIETLAWDVSAYVPTNVISITDGQIYLEADLFNSWIRPAINVWLSVSRVWGSAQTKAVKKVSWKLRLELATFRELAAFSQFWSDLDKSTRNKLERWKRLTELLKQGPNSPIPFNKMTVAIYAAINGYLDGLEVNQVLDFEAKIYEKLDGAYNALSEDIKTKREMTAESEVQVKALLDEVKQEI